MSLVLYTISGAPCPWRVLVGLALKRLTCDIRVLKASAGEHKKPPFVTLNPRGTVPVLVSGKSVVRDSIGCLAWLDQFEPRLPLFGNTVGEAANIWESTLDISQYLRQASSDVFTPVLVEQCRPGPGSSEESELVGAVERLKAEWGQLELRLETGPFLAGSEPSAADAVAFPDIRLVQRAVETRGELGKRLGFTGMSTEFPRLSAWQERMAARPGVSETLPPHWRG